MKAIRTMKVRVNGTAKTTILVPVWLKSVNWLSGIVFKTKDTNSNRVHKACYAQLRERGLPSQLACSASKTVCATYNTMKSKGEWGLAEFKRPVLPLVLNRDFRRTRKGLRLWGENLTVTDSRPLPETGWKDSKIKRVGRHWYLILCYEVEIPEPKTEGCVVGVDMGVKRLIAATNSCTAKPFFYRGGELNHRRQSIRRTRAVVQSVGTRSSRRLLQRMSGNEAAVTSHLLHAASKALVGYSVGVGARRIVVEDLTNLRDSSLSKGKDLRSKIQRWPYADMRFKIAYKAAGVGIETEAVSPRNTSRCCPKCGYVSASNRRGLYFHCQKCGHKGDADQVASANIRARSVSIACNAMETGSNKPPQSSEPHDIGSVSFVTHGDSVPGVGSRLKPPASCRR